MKPKTNCPQKNVSQRPWRRCYQAKGGEFHEVLSRSGRKLCRQEKTRVIAEPSADSVSDDYRPLGTILLQLPVELAAREEAVAVGQGTSGASTHEEWAAAKVQNTKAKRAKKNPNRPALVSRECVSNSSQEEGDLETQRVREPEKVRGDANLWTKWEMMIGSITRENPRGAEKSKNPKSKGYGKKN